MFLLMSWASALSSLTGTAAALAPSIFCRSTAAEFALVGILGFITGFFTGALVVAFISSPTLRRGTVRAITAALSEDIQQNTEVAPRSAQIPLAGAEAPLVLPTSTQSARDRLSFYRIPRRGTRFDE